MAHSALQGHIELVPETVKRKLHLKATVTAKRNRIGTFRVLTSRKEDFTGICLFGVGFAHDFHAAKAIGNLRVCFHGFNISFKAMNIACLLFNLSREVFQKLIFHTVLLALVVSFQHLQPCHINVQVHLFLDKRIAGTQRLDLRIGQRLLIHIVTGANR